MLGFKNRIRRSIIKELYFALHWLPFSRFVFSGMLQHTLTLIYRNIVRFPGTFLINVLGLSTGLTCSLLIYLWIADEMSFDKFHENESRIFQVIENQHNSAGTVSREATPFGMAYVLRETMPEVEYAATVTPPAWFPKFGLESRNGRVKGEGRFVGKDFFKIFSFHLVQGDRNDVLSDINSVVISEALAITIFGSIDAAVGKSISWDMSTINKESNVTGVFKNVSPNSSEQFDLVFNIDLLGKIMNLPKDDLAAPGPSTFVMLKPGIDLGIFNRKISELMSARTTNKQADFFASKFSDKYLHSYGRIEYVKLFGMVGLIILVVASINFMNLSTAKASRRLKEIGVKKAIGAWRSSLVMQFFVESMLISLLSMVVALTLALLLLPVFNDVTDKQIVFEVTKERALSILGITLATGVLAGIYPALHLSGFKPGQILKGKIVSSYSETMVRKGLVIFQFTVSIVFILSVLVIHRQMSYIQSKNLGFDKDNVLYFEIEGAIASSKDAFIDAARAASDVVNASAMVGNVVGVMGGPQDMTFDNKTVPVHRIAADYGMVETLGIAMKSGRSFSQDFNDAGKIVINVAAMEQLGITDAVGKTVAFQNGKFEIIGVSDNFHGSLYEKISPMVFMLETNQLLNIFVKLDRSKQSEAIRNLKSLYEKFNPGYAFDYKFVDSAYQAQYKGEQQIASLSLWFSILAIIISCMGLFGLSAFTVEKRVKEIGIRKVLGASPASIAYILSFEFVKLVLVAIVVALPVSFFVIQGWLQRFAYTIDLSVWFFVITGLIAIVVAVATVGGQSIRASFANPTDCLKEE
jgi:ABC-type antimicrobial peptide transport system permease subunit